MENTTLRSFLAALLLLILAGTAAAQDEAPSPTSTDTIEAYQRKLFEWGRARVDQAADAAAVELPEAVAAMPTSTGQTSGFAGRVNEGIEDFLPLFQFAIDSVSTSDDQKSVTLKLNPIRAGRFGSIQVKATVAEPEPFDALLAEIPEAERAAQIDAIRSQIDDFSDLTYTAAYGYEPRPDSAANLDAVGTLWGRNHQVYSRFVGEFLSSWTTKVVADLTPRQTAAARALSDFQVRLTCGGRDLGLLATPAGDEGLCPPPPQTEHPDPSAPNEGSPAVRPAPSRKEWDALTLAEAQEILAGEFGRFLDVLQEDIARTVDDAVELESLALLPFLVDNQPQATLEVAYRDPDALVGRRSWTASATVEVGQHNFNTLVRTYRRKVTDKANVDISHETLQAEAFQELVDRQDQVRSGEKFSLSATYVDRDAYSQDYTFGDDEPTTASLALDEESEFSGKLEWIRNATWHPILIDGKEQYPRLILSAERSWVSDDSRRDRWVGNLTYNIPLQGGLSLPLSLVYANHAEFLGEPDEQFSAHLGLNFKFDADATAPGAKP